MTSEEFSLNFQVGTTSAAHKILTALAAKPDDDDDGKSVHSKAPFSSMADAYLFALMLGLSAGKKEKVSNVKTYANFIQSVAKSNGEEIDVATLLSNLGEEGDMVSRKAAKKAIEEYATWGLLRLGKAKLGEDDYRISTLLDEILSE